MMYAVLAVNSSAAIDAVVTLTTLALGALGGIVLVRLRARRHATPKGRVLLALAGADLSCAAVDAAARIGRADDAVVVPAVLVETPYRLPLDCALPEAASQAFDVLEVVETRLRRAGVTVDARVVQGRTRRHALRRLVEQERFDRLVVPAADGDDSEGFGADDIAWLLAHVDGEVLVLRPGRTAPAGLSATATTVSHPTPVGVASRDATGRLARSEHFPFGRPPARPPGSPRSDPGPAPADRG